jgi:hypothetical protein
MTEEQTRGSLIQERLDAIGITDREFHAHTGIDRKTLRRAVADDPSVRAKTSHLIENWLTRREESHRLPATLVASAPAGQTWFRSGCRTRASKSS